MTCQHTLFSPAGEFDAPRVSPLPCEHHEPAVLFHPIVDTFAHCVLAHECLVRTVEVGTEDAHARKLAIHSAARQNPGGLYFLRFTPSAIDDPEYDLGMTCEWAANAGLPLANLVFDVAEADLAREREHSRRIREYVAARGFQFALSGAGVAAGPDAFENVRDFAPEHIRVDRRLVRSVDRPAAAATISQLARIADRSGAHLIAEGVDRIRILESLWLLGMRFMQGDLFGRPAPRVI